MSKGIYFCSPFFNKLYKDISISEPSISRSYTTVTNGRLNVESIQMQQEATISWQGWTTTLSQLKLSGWRFNSKPKYSNWRDPDNSAKSNAYLYIWNPSKSLMGRIKLNEHANCTGELDYLMPMKVARATKAVFIQHAEEALLELENQVNELIEAKAKVEEAPGPYDTEEDIPELMAIIARIQGARSASKVKKVQKVIDFKDYFTKKRA